MTSRSNMAVWSYGSATVMGVCEHCDLDLGDMTLVQGHYTPAVMDNNFVKYYPDPTWFVGCGLTSHPTICHDKIYRVVTPILDICAL